MAGPIGHRLLARYRRHYARGRSNYPGHCR